MTEPIESGKSMKPLFDSCVCGTITYGINAPLSDVINCDCSMCRQAAGTALQTHASVKVQDFRFLSGENALMFSNRPLVSVARFARFASQRPLLDSIDF